MGPHKPTQSNPPPVLEYGRERSDRTFANYQPWRNAYAFSRAQLLGLFAQLGGMLLTAALIYLARGTVRWVWTLPCMIAAGCLAELFIWRIAPQSWKRLP